MNTCLTPAHLAADTETVYLRLESAMSNDDILSHASVPPRILVAAGLYRDPSITGMEITIFNENIGA
jgi:hypothetical protein